VNAHSGAASSGGRPDELLERFHGEILHWNRQINLISRVQPERRARDLIADSRLALAALPGGLCAWDEPAADFIRGGRGPAGAASPLRRIALADIGSGAGLPGIVWHVCLSTDLAASGEDPPLSTFLVEPRQKRAWFLARVARQLGLSGIAVVARRWDESGIRLSMGARAGAGGTLWLLVLRALSLPESVVLAGWCEAAGRQELAGEDRLVTIRFRYSEAERREETEGRPASPSGEALTITCEQGEGRFWLDLICYRQLPAVGAP
jgi:16S rRNA G527 N7-methylase RsmG